MSGGNALAWMYDISAQAKNIKLNPTYTGILDPDAGLKVSVTEEQYQAIYDSWLDWQRQGTNEAWDHYYDLFSHAVVDYMNDYIDDNGVGDSYHPHIPVDPVEHIG